MLVAPMLRAIPLLAVLAGAAHADEVRPFPVTAISPGVAGHAGKLAGLDVGGWGPNLELAIGSRRWQYFLEVGLQLAQLGPESNRIHGKQRRAGLGVRWLARSFELGPRGATDAR